MTSTLRLSNAEVIALVRSSLEAKGYEVGTVRFISDVSHAQWGGQSTPVPSTANAYAEAEIAVEPKRKTP